jgi:hypothetical protein
MALLVQTPRGTVSLPPQGFFQQQPSPFQSLLSPTGLPPAPPPLQFQPRIPAPVDINSAASAVQPSSPTPPRNVIPQSSPRRISELFPDEEDTEAPAGFDPNSGRDNANPFSSPFDPADVFGVVGTVAGPLGFGAVGRGFGNLAAFANEPPAIQNEINPFSAFLNSITPFGLLGKSVEDQARDVARDFERTVFEDALNTPFDDPFVNPAFEPFFDEPISFIPFPDEADDDSGPGPGPGSATDNAANQGQEDEAEDPDSGPDGGPDGSDGPDGDSSYICTAAWDTGISAPETWSLNRRFGVWIRRNDPLAYEGYSVFGPWIADRIRDGKLRWIGKLKPQCWAYEMAQRSGKDTSGFPLSIKIVNRIQRATTRPLVRLLGWYVSK